MQFRLLITNNTCYNCKFRKKFFKLKLVKFYLRLNMSHETDERKSGLTIISTKKKC